MLGLLTGGGADAVPPAEAQEEAEILIEAMCNAAKCDGDVDAAERELILGKMGDLDAKVAFLKSHLASALDVQESIVSLRIWRNKSMRFP